MERKARFGVVRDPQALSYSFIIIILKAESIIILRVERFAFPSADVALFECSAEGLHQGLMELMDLLWFHGQEPAPAQLLAQEILCLGDSAVVRTKNELGNKLRRKKRAG